MSSLAQTLSHKTQSELSDLSLLASQGAAIAVAISVDESLDALPKKTLITILYDLHQKFEQIEQRLDAI
ncbi:hypothetical protein [Neptunomonas marina]|uniref:Uncharacterized protein n=1 Tax=Neptunomonas marina TaxID=1815562 RepID=A0A437QE68_9GAMM|nr:hypothetical protein [Neptunomonas marina]RVU32729.1 hypothetical protein EOE65_03475 [Neptunomonas marina]